MPPGREGRRTEESLFSSSNSLKIRLPFIFLSVGFFLILLENGNSQEVIPELNDKIDSFILLEIEKSFGGTLQNIQNNLGEAQKITEKKTENIHVRDVEETVLEVQYSGISFVFLKENELHKEFLVEAILTGKDFDLSWGVRIGIPPEKVIEVFGNPDRQLENNSIYRYLDFEKLNWVDFYFEGNSLFKIHWIFYVD
jgi:hypothetical protein